jgi:hypothetical protein
MPPPIRYRNYETEYLASGPPAGTHSGTPPSAALLTGHQPVPRHELPSQVRTNALYRLLFIDAVCANTDFRTICCR